MQKRELACLWVFGSCIVARKLRQGSVSRIAKAAILSISIKTSVDELIQKQAGKGRITIMIHV